MAIVHGPEASALASTELDIECSVTPQCTVVMVGPTLANTAMPLSVAIRPGSCFEDDCRPERLSLIHI